MRINKFLNTRGGAVVALGAVVGVIGFFAQRKAAETAVALGNAVNPVYSGNIFHSGVNAVGEKITGKPFSLGAWVYDITHRNNE